MTLAKTYDVTYTDKLGNLYNTQVLGFDVRHAINSALELMPEAVRITRVIQSPLWR